MSHQVPDYYRYVSGITIVNPGSGYTSIPTITISGGGGTGATATASIFNGQIQAVNITNSGEGYTTAPDVTVTGGGGANAELTSTVAFAAGTPSEYSEKSAIGAKFTLPEFVQNDYNKFVTFIEKYYEFMDSEGNPSNLLLNKDYHDIDELNDTELNKRALELAKDFPQILETDRKTLFKKIKNIYESKGSERSIKAYFKLLYNEDVEVYYPSKNILRASDGVWIEETSVRANSGFNNYEVLNLNGKLADIKYYETVGSVTFLRNIEVTIPRVEKLTYTSPQAYEVVVELPAGITEVPGPGAQATATATVVAGVITEIDVTFGGYDYVAAPEVRIFDSSGNGATARAIVSDGEITSILVTDGGSGYSGTNTTVSLDTESVRSFIVDRGASAAEENIRAYLDRSLSSVVSGTYSGTDAGFSVGDVFAINESGDDGTGYAVPGYFAGDYTYTGGSNNAVIRVTNIDENGVPTSWSIINPGEGFINSQTVITIESKTVESLDITLFTKYLYSYDGKYKDDRGKLSDVNRLQDNYKYQSFSYIIKSTISQNQWVKRFRDLIHPAGMQVFGDLIITNNVNYAPFISITTEGLNLHVFKTEDIVVSNDDVIEFVINYNRSYTDTASISELAAISVEKPFSDSAGASDAYDEDDYGGPDYLPENYVGSGVSKLVEKVLVDTTTSLDVFEKVIAFNPSFSDSATSSESASVAVGTSLSDSATVSELFSYQKIITPFFTDTSVSAEQISFLVNKSLSDTTTNTDVFERVVSYNREFADSSTTSEDFVFNMSADLGNEVVVVDDLQFEIFIPVTVSDSVSVTNGEISFELAPALFCNNPAVVSEIPVINISKALVENQTATDAQVITVDKPFSETGNVADSGVITIQDYSDPTYFSEDYVGAGYSF